MPRLANWRWRTIFWPERSVVSTVRKPSDDRPQAPAATGAAVPDIGAIVILGGLRIPAGFGGRLGADAPDRRGASALTHKGASRSIEIPEEYIGKIPVFFIGTAKRGPFHVDRQNLHWLDSSRQEN
jgi:hypothetical protein